MTGNPEGTTFSSSKGKDKVENGIEHESSDTTVISKSSSVPNMRPLSLVSYLIRNLVICRNTVVAYLWHSWGKVGAKLGHSRDWHSFGIVDLKC